MKKFDQINVIPFIDIMLVLLAIVLMTATFISQGKIQVSVPKTSSNDAIQRDDIVRLVTITAEGEFYYNDEPVSLDALETAFSKVEPTEKITLKVDAEVMFQDFVSVTDLLSGNGLTNVSVVTEKKTSAMVNE